MYCYSANNYYLCGNNVALSVNRKLNNFTNKNKQNLFNYELFFMQFISWKEVGDERDWMLPRTFPSLPYGNEPRGIDQSRRLQHNLCVAWC